MATARRSLVTAIAAVAAAAATLGPARPAAASKFQLAVDADTPEVLISVPITLTIYVKTDTYQPNPSQAFLNAMAGGSGATQAGGIRGFQVDLISVFHGHSNVLPINNTNWKWAGAIASDFSINKGLRRDAFGGPNGYVADGDLDDEGISINDAGGFANTTLGTQVSSTLVTSGKWAGWSKVADIKWMFTDWDSIQPYVIGPSYYDADSPGTNFFTLFTDVEVTPWVPNIIPEPATPALALAAPALALRRRPRAGVPARRIESTQLPNEEVL